MSYDEKNFEDEKVPVGSVNINEVADFHVPHVKESGADEAAILAANNAGMVITEEEDKRVLRKIDWHLLPLMMGLYLVQFMGMFWKGFGSIRTMQ